MSERRWTTRELRQAQRQGAVIRAWGRDEVRWDPRGPGDREPWESYGVRFSARECRPESPDGGPWTGPQNDDHGSEEPTVNPKLLKALAPMEPDDNRTGVVDPDRADIAEWAEDEKGGNLPRPSARAFAAYLEDAFYDYNEDGECTNEAVFKGGLDYWVGGRTY